MASKNGIDSTLSTREVPTEMVPAVNLVDGNQIILEDGEIATVREVSLFAHGVTMRDRKIPRCRIRVSIPNERGSSGRSVIANQGDCFTKLVGVKRV